MAIRIQRQADTRLAKPIKKRIGDIPGGVGIDASVLGGSILAEGTPIGKGTNGLYNVVKTAKLVTAATNSATTYEVAKGSHFKVGQFLAAVVGGKAYAITAIDKTTNADKDVITVGTTLGVAVAIGGVLFEAAAESTTTTSAYKDTALALAGEGCDVVSTENLFCSALTHGVALESINPPVTSAIKALIPGVVFI